MLEKFGWQAIYLAAGFPLLMIPILLRFLPESMPFLMKSNRLDELKDIVVKLDPTYRPLPGDRLVLPTEDSVVEAPVQQLFQNGRGWSTIMFWVAFFMCLFMTYALSSWLPKLMASAGFSFDSTITFVMVLNFGAVVGAIGGGWLADKFHAKHVLMFFFAMAGVSISMLGYGVAPWMLYILVGVAGATTIGTQLLAYAYVGQFYPKAVRSTGIGWASGVGRIGAILAPIMIGALVARNLSLQQNFLIIAAPAIVAVLAISLIRRSASADEMEVQLSLAKSPATDASL